MAWALIQAEAFTARKLSVVQLVATLRAACHEKSARLSAGSEMFQKLLDLPTYHVPMSQEKGSGEKKQTNGRDREITTSPAPRPKALHHLAGTTLDEVEAEEYEEWRDSKGEGEAAR